MESPGFLIAVALATGGLVVLHLLWQILRVPIAAPRGFRQLRQLPATAALAAPFDAAQAELGALGFERDGWVVVEAVPNEANPMRVFGCMRHRSEPVLAAIQLRPELQQAGNCRVVFHSLLTDGRLLRTYNPVLLRLPPDSPYDERQDACAASLSAQWAFHRGSVHERRAQVAPLPPTARLVGLALESDRCLIDWRVQQRQFERDDAGTVRCSVRSAIALLLRGSFTRRRTSVEDVPVSPERQAILFNHWAWMRRQAPRRRVQRTFFALSALACSLPGAALWSVGTALGIFVALIVHEGIRHAAQRTAGYRNVSIRMIPLLGGDTAASGQRPSAVRAAWVDLLGPLLGIVIGGLLHAARPLDANGGIAALASCFLFVNGLSLLPLSPLDGGRFLRAIVPPRYARITVLVEGMVLFALLLACMRGQAVVPTLLIASLLVLLSRRVLLAEMIETLALPAAAAAAPRGRDPIARIAMALDLGAFARTTMTGRMPLIRRIHDDLRRVPATRLQASLLFVVYAALLALVVSTAVHLLPDPSARSADRQARATEMDSAGTSIAAQADTLDVAHLVAAFREEPGAVDARVAAPYDHDAVDARFSALLGRVASADEHRVLAAGVVVDDYEPQVAAMQSLRAAAPSAFEAFAAGAARTLDVRRESDGDRHAVAVDALGDALAFARRSRSEWLVLPHVADGAAQPVWAVTFVTGQPPTAIEHASLRDWFASQWQALRMRALLREGIAPDAARHCDDGA